ncbi:MAG: 2-C-methyl-D-erythritol 2,4-cyclodiphosphate synthase [Flavobacteriales bacterium]|nr:2-C-methyl-D-erythritol 2,4-cyclodiphosphate synthase [Flavobacteriales bacterium]MBL6873600.1 2-C-methyl-D-erythritol 2,4-cyclodiphosphate synthase [Flavobacteriales bacterium]
MNIRIGYGYDVHQLKEGEDLIVGGIHIPHYKGSFGHSDADVLIHTICDAILGAANMRDIGFHFPDTSADYKGIDSKLLLRDVMDLIRNKGYEIINIDSTVCLEKPKVNPHIPQMKTVLSKCMNIDENQLSIKATTSEKMGFVGQEMGVSAHAVALIKLA